MGSHEIIRFRESKNSPSQWGIRDATALYPLKGPSTLEEIFKAWQDGSLKRDAMVMPTEDFELAVPTDKNPHIYCAGLNYRQHAAEMDMPLPESPVFFTKSPGALTAHKSDVIIPPHARLIDYEVELALIVGRAIARDDLMDSEPLSKYILGITILNDLSARDIQLQRGQWFTAKSYRTFAPLGPSILTLSKEVEERLGSLTCTMTIARDGAGEIRQKGSTADMIFSPRELINELKKTFTLQPGDILSTGTPSGVAMGKRRSHETIADFIDREEAVNRRYLRSGDRMEALLESNDGTVRLGPLENYIL